MDTTKFKLITKRKRIISFLDGFAEETEEQHDGYKTITQEIIIPPSKQAMERLSMHFKEHYIEGVNYFTDTGSFK